MLTNPVTHSISIYQHNICKNRAYYKKKDLLEN